MKSKDQATPSPGNASPGQEQPTRDALAANRATLVSSVSRSMTGPRCALHRAVAIFAAMLACASTIAPRETLAQSPELLRLLDAAQQAREAGDLARCLELLDQAYGLAPSPELVNNRARVLEELGRYGEAAALYKSVADDPSADPNLRSLDASRFAGLQPKLNRGWLAAIVAPEGALLWVNGTPTGGTNIVELPAEVGRNILEISHPSSAVVALRRVGLPAGERTSFREDLGQPAPTDGALSLNPAMGPALSWTIDGYDLKSELSSRTAIRVSPGVYEVKVSLLRGTQWTETVRVPPSTQVVVGEAYEAPVETPVATVTQEPPGLSPWPFVVAGVGLAMAGVGTWLLVDGAQDRDEVESARTEPRVLPDGTTQVVTGVTMKRALELEDSANLKTGLGATFVGLGGAAVVGGVLWWLLDDSGAPESAGRVQVGVSPSGLVVGGRF